MKRPNCKYPENVPTGAYRKGCRCDECLENTREKYRRYYEENREKVREKRLRYYEENREKVLEKQRRYREENREKERERNRRYREENREKVLEKDRRYREENPTTYYLSKMNSKIKKNYPKAIIELSQHENEQMENLVEELIRRKKESIDNCSACCNGEGCVDCILTIDHIKPLSKGGLHHPDNLQILTFRENAIKNDSWDGISGC